MSSPPTCWTRHCLRCYSSHVDRQVLMTFLRAWVGTVNGGAGIDQCTPELPCDASRTRSCVRFRRHTGRLARLVDHRVRDTVRCRVLRGTTWSVLRWVVMLGRPGGSRWRLWFFLGGVIVGWTMILVAAVIVVAAIVLVVRALVRFRRVKDDSPIDTVEGER